MFIVPAGTPATIQEVHETQPVILREQTNSYNHGVIPDETGRGKAINNYEREITSSITLKCVNYLRTIRD